MTDYGKYRKEITEGKPTYNEAKERRKKQLEMVRKNRAQWIKNSLKKS